METQFTPALGRDGVTNYDSFNSKDGINSDTNGSTTVKRKARLMISSVSKDEPIVTRRELWSYYCMCSIGLPPSLNLLKPAGIVYYNGDNVYLCFHLVSRSNTSIHPRVLVPSATRRLFSSPSPLPPDTILSLDLGLLVPPVVNV
jgi:hypothetical protein